jgi:hypothetical protein
MHVNGASNTIPSHSLNEQESVSGAMDSGRFAKVMSSVETQESAGLDNSARLAMDTNHGYKEINLDDYFSMKPAQSPVNLDDIPLLMPTAHNVEVLSKYSETRFKNLLSEYNIPTPPATIEFDAAGQLVLPADYPYAAELKQALSEQPDVERALSATAAIASHYAGIMEGAAFRDEMSIARSKADEDRIVQKYNYLFDDNRPAVQTILAFTEDGNMLVGQTKA